VSCAGPSRPPARSSPRPAEAPAAGHNLPSCLAHAAVPLMINRQEARGCTCCTRSGQTVGTRQDWSGCPLQNARHRRGRRAKYPPICRQAQQMGTVGSAVPE
jgi:hypothetical protein